MSSNSDTGASKSGSGNGRKGAFVPPSPTDLDVILDQYEFIEMLGRGGMGAVYKARQKSLDRIVAIKILPPNLTEDEEEEGFHFAERFQREARAMAKLSHPNIIAVYDFGQASDGQFYFVMEYVEGSDLHGLIRTGELTTAHVSGWMSQICDALQYAHSKGIVHRDIKPANIMITLDGQVKVADFGLAKITGADAVETKLTMTNMAMGTPDYVAPEALEADMEVDHRADLYAVGVMLYEMLTGKVPRGAWKLPSTQITGLDPRFDGLIERAMDADREERFQQASEISATLYEIATTPASLSTHELIEPDRTDSEVLTGQKSQSVTLRSGAMVKSGKTPQIKDRAKLKRPLGLVVSILGATLVLGGGGLLVLKNDPASSTLTEPITPPAPAETPKPAVSATELPTAPRPGDIPESSIPTPGTIATAQVADSFSGVESPLAIHSIRVTPATTETLKPTVDPRVPPRGRVPDEDPAVRFTNTLERLLDGITELDLGDRVPGVIEMRGPDAIPFLTTQDDRVFGVAADPRDPSLPRVVALTHGFFLQSVGQFPGNLRLFENSLAWMAGEGKPALLICPDELRWGGKQWAIQNGYRVEQRPPEGGGGVLVLAENRAYQSEENRRLIQEMLPKLDGVFTALTPWANINQTEFPEHPAGEIFAPFGFEIVYGNLGVIGKWERPAEMPAENAAEENWIDLLTLVDGERDSLMGPWTLEDGLLRSPANPKEFSPVGHTTLAMAPPEPSDHYDLRWRISRDAPGHVIVFPFSAGRKNHYVAFDVRSRKGSSVDLVGTPEATITRDSDFFETGKTHEVMLSVRGDLVRISFDGGTLFEEKVGVVGLRDIPFFPREKITGPVLGVGVCAGHITVHEASYRAVESVPDLSATTGPNRIETDSSRNADDLPTKIAAAAAADPRIAQLEQGFQATYERDANSRFKNDLAKLDQGYLGALDRARTTAQRAGDLTAVTLLDEEKARISGGKGVPPAEGDPGDPAPLAALRMTYRETHQKLERERSSRAVPLTEKYLSALVSYESELTRANEIEKALAVRELRDLVATRGKASIPAESKPAASDPVNAPSTSANLRDLPRGRVKGFGVRGSGDPLNIDGREFLLDFSDHRDVVRVYQAPHWSHALTAKGELLGFLAPPERENRQITSVSLGYFCSMSLRENGTIGVPVEQNNVNPPGTPLESIKDAVSIASNTRAAAILRASGELIVWADAGGSAARVELEEAPVDLVSLHSTESHLMARDKKGQFHAIHPRGNPPLVVELNAVKKLKEVETSPYASHWLAMDEEGKVFAGPANSGEWTIVPEDLGKGTTLRVGKQLSAVRLESGEWRAWGNTGGGVVEKINSLGPNVHDLSMDSFDEEKTKLIWIE